MTDLLVALGIVVAALLGGMAWGGKRARARDKGRHEKAARQAKETRDEVDAMDGPARDRELGRWMRD